jgi:hypothetical protein
MKRAYNQTEHLAFNKLKPRHNGINKNGLKVALSQIVDKTGCDPVDMPHHMNCGFIPDATLFDGDKLRIFEIVKTHGVTDSKMRYIERFSMDIYDCSEVLVEVIEVSGDGERESVIYRSEDDIR